MNQFEKYCVIRFKSIKKNLKEYIEEDDKEGLHQFRLELKKINALLHFIEHASGSKKIREADKEIISLLKNAGELRDAGNFKKLVAEFKLPKSISCEAVRQRQLEKATETLKSNHKHHHSLNRTQAQLSNEAKKLTLVQLKNYAAELVDDISINASNKIPTDELHELRKKIKDALYLLKLSSAKKTNSKTKLLLEKLDECQDVIGQWHDIDKFKQRVKKVKHPHLKSKMVAVEQEKKRLLTEAHRLILLLK